MIRKGFGGSRAGGIRMSKESLASRLPGRLRVRHPAMKDPAVCRRLADEIAGWDGVVSSEGNPVTGGLLLIYDPALAVPADMEARVSALVSRECGVMDAAGRPSAGVSPSFGRTLRQLNRPAKIGMLGSLALSLAALPVNRRLHAAAGVFYLGLLSLHLARHRGKLTK